MKLLYSHGLLIGREGAIHLLRLENKWYVVGQGFLCSVDEEDEGRQLIRNLEAAQARGEPLLDYLAGSP